MSKEMTKTQIQTKQPLINASVELWARFDEWMRVQGCQTLPEGLRAAIREVTNFKPESQG